MHEKKSSFFIIIIIVRLSAAPDMLNKKLLTLPKRSEVSTILNRLITMASLTPSTYRIVITAIFATPSFIPGTGIGTGITLSI